MAFLKRAAILGALLLTLWLTQAPAQAPAQASAQAPEYQVKAAILYKFAVFVEWPAEAFATDTSPFIVCVLGKDPFGGWLQQEMGEATVDTHPVEIRYLENTETISECHMVFVSRSEEARLESVLNPFKEKNVLIVSDISNIKEFFREGGMIGLEMKENKVSFKLNLKAIERARLRVDSRLKRIAKSVES